MNRSENFWGGAARVDYIIVATRRYYTEIARYGEQILGIDRKKFINGRVLKIPFFNWQDYLRIYEADISIVSDWCYGAVLSNTLGLPFNSPFVNVRVGYEWDDYHKLLSKLDYYMSYAPDKENIGKYKGKNWSGCEGRIDYPRLWYDDIMLHGFHYNSLDEFYNVWEKRRKRYNRERKLIMQILYDKRDLDMFRELKYENKLGFYGTKVDDENILYIDMKKTQTYHFLVDVNAYIENGDIYKDVDIFKLLWGDKNYRKS